MICPHCGKEQPIADLCSACNQPLLHSEPIQIIEEEPIAKWIWALFGFSVILFGVGIFFLWPHLQPPKDSKTLASKHSPTAQAAQVSTTPIATATAAEVTPTPKNQIGLIFDMHPRSVALSSALGAQFKSRYSDWMLSNEEPNWIQDDIQNFSWMIAMGTKGIQTWHQKLKNQNKTSDLSLAHILIYNDESSMSLDTRVFKESPLYWLSQKPNPSVIILVLEQVIRRGEKSMSILFHPKNDDAYATRWFGEGLKLKYQTKLHPIQSLPQISKTLKTIPKNTGLLILMSSPIFQSQQAKNRLIQWSTQTKIPLIVIGEGMSTAQPMMEITSTATAIQKSISKILNDSGKNTSTPWFPDGPIDLKFDTTRAKEINHHQSEIVVNVLKNQKDRTIVSIR